MTPKNAKWWKAGSEAVQTRHPINTNQTQSDQNQDDKLLKRIKGAKAVASQTSLLPSKISWYQLTALCLPNLKTKPQETTCLSFLPLRLPDSATSLIRGPGSYYMIYQLYLVSPFHILSWYNVKIFTLSASPIFPQELQIWGKKDWRSIPIGLSGKTKFYSPVNS